ncbi:MAG TPA: NAD(P)-dependent oxidoreductase [Pseudonocardia sp.]|nr:NAD(P)-dependent oxidoreductase [Pseudonocardia sp.]
MRILVLGATGVAGRSLLPPLLDAGHDVRAHVRSAGNEPMIRGLGARPLHGDPEDRATLTGWLSGCDAAVDLRVAIPPPSRAALPAAWRRYRHLRDTATGLLVDAAVDAGVPRLVHDTVTMVYADGGDAVIEEDHPVDAPGALAANLAAERHLGRFSQSGGTGVALRFGAFYGPSDEFSRSLVRAARAGRALVVGPPQGWTSAIHTDDVGPALLAALSAPPGVYNVVDDEPLRRSELLEILASAAGRPGLRRYPEWTTRLAAAPVRALARSHRVSARLFTETTGWRPRVPGRRAGWPQVFATGPALPGREAHDR